MGNTPTTSSFLINRPDRGQLIHQNVYQGSPYLTYPIYGNGALYLTANQPPITCMLAFNLVSSEISCLVPGDSIEHRVLPSAFTINGRHFVAQQEPAGKRQYYEVVYTGKSRILVDYSARLTLTNQEAYHLEEAFDGIYTQRERYFIERDMKTIQEVKLTKKSILKALAISKESKLVATLNDKLTLRELIGLVASYDGFP